MKYNNIWLILLLSFVILISGCFHEGIDKKTAECIASTSKVYISGQCENCVMQEEVFGESYIYMNVIDCKLNQEDCIEKDIMEVLKNIEKHVLFVKRDDNERDVIKQATIITSSHRSMIFIISGISSAAKIVRSCEERLLSILS